MGELRDELPKGPGAMYDLLHEWFGIGNYDDIASNRPFHRDRMVEIAKLKGLMKSRRASLAEVYYAACYAREHKKPIHSTWQVFALIPEAMRDRFQEAVRAKRADRWMDLDTAMQEARDAGEDEWVERLFRADDHAKAIEEWRQHRG